MKLEKPYSDSQYADLAVYCNANNCHIEDKGEYLESVENAPYIPTIEDTVAQLQVYLATTDWYVTRFAETGEAIPESIKTARAEARLKISEMRDK